jgi:hypothetical protein
MSNFVRNSQGDFIGLEEKNPIIYIYIYIFCYWTLSII